MANISDSSKPKAKQFLITLNQQLIDDIDAFWKKEGYNNRSEFFRNVMVRELREATSRNVPKTGMRERTKRQAE